MFEAKSGLRNFATKITALSLGAGLLLGTSLGAAASSANAAANAPKLPATVAFLKQAFTGTDLKTRMNTGFALEAFSQLAGAGVKASALGTEINGFFTRSNRAIGNQTSPGYLVDPTTLVLKPGLAGKFLYASKVLKSNNFGLQFKVATLLGAQIDSNGSVAVSNGNAQDVAWVALGLTAFGNLALARRVDEALLKMQHSDGGFNYDPTLTVGGTDVTAIAIQALEAVKPQNKAAAAKRNKAVTAAVAFLKATAVGGNHFEAYGDVDPNGTAYAVMGLKSAGISATPFVAWLQSHLQSDGGIEAPWAPGAGDRFVTAQGYLPLIGETYVSLLARK
jgi:hypothetical protein